MAGFSRSNSSFECFVVPHFTHEHDVGVFPHQGPQGFVEGQTVDANFTLVDVGFVVLEQVFDGVLDGDDVATLSLIDVLQHRSNGGRLARTGHPGKQN